MAWRSIAWVKAWRTRGSAKVRMVLVEHREAVVDDRAAQDLELGVLLDARDLVGRHVADEVELAGQQAVDAARHLRHDDAA